MSLINREVLLSFEKMDADLCATCGEHHTAEDVIMMIKTAPTVDAVPVEKYNELREAFVDYVCSGVNNQAPYCKNRIDGDCVDERGWCTYRHCRGFNPDGERKDGDGNG